MKRIWHTLARGWFLYVVIIVVIASIGAYGYYQLRQAVEQPVRLLAPPLEVLELPPSGFHQTAYCPGDVLSYRLAIVIKRAPIATFRFESWWSETEQYMIQPARGLAWSGWDTVETVRTNYQTKVPDGFPAGDYELRITMQEINSSPNIVKIEFTVPESCFSETLYLPMRIR